MIKLFLSYWLITAFFIFPVVALSVCSAMTNIRIHNVSPYDFTDVQVSNQYYGNIKSGAKSAYRSVPLHFRYAAMKMKVDGKYVTGQALHFGAERFTYRINILDLTKGHLAIDVIRD